MNRAMKSHLRGLADHGLVPATRSKKGDKDKPPMPKRLQYTTTEKDIRIEEIFDEIKFLALRELHPDILSYFEWISTYQKVIISHETVREAKEYLPSALGFKTRPEPISVEDWIKDVREENQRRINDGMGLKALKDVWAPYPSIC
jgi:hypothetical protein